MLEDWGRMVFMYRWASKLQKIAEFMIMVRGEAFSPRGNVQGRRHGKVKQEGVGTDRLVKQGVELNDCAEEFGLGREGDGRG